MTDKTFLEHMASDEHLEDHDPEECGLCYHRRLWAEVAREMLASDDVKDAIARWEKEVRRRWEESKFFKLWQEEKAAGRDPHKAFAERGWEP